MEPSANGTVPRILRRPEVLSITGLGDRTLDRLIAAGQFPEKVQIGLRAVGWPEESVRRWVESPGVEPSSALPDYVRTAAAELAAGVERCKAADVEYSRINVEVQALKGDVDFLNAAEAARASLQERHSMAVAREAIGDAVDVAAKQLAIEINDAEARLVQLRTSVGPKRAAFDYLVNRREEAAKPVREAVAQRKVLEHAVACALERSAAEDYLGACKAMYAAHCRHRACQYLAERLNPRKGPFSIPLRGVMNFTPPGFTRLCESDGSEVIFSGADYYDDAEVEERKELAALGVAFEHEARP